MKQRLSIIAVQLGDFELYVNGMRMRCNDVETDSTLADIQDYLTQAKILVDELVKRISTIDNMTDEQVIKAALTCMSGTHNCVECPLKGIDRCCEVMESKAMDTLSRFPK